MSDTLLFMLKNFILNICDLDPVRASNNSMLGPGLNN
jgi:hypothetical protein